MVHEQCSWNIQKLKKLGHTSEDFYDSHDALAFGRPGCGAPARTKSGRIRTTLIGNPDIRFQANEGVQKSISNNIRWSWCLFIHVEERKTNNSTLNSSRNPNKELQNENVCSGCWWAGSLSCRAGRTGESESEIESEVRNPRSPKTTFTWKAGAQAGTLVGNQKLSQK